MKDILMFFRDSYLNPERAFRNLPDGPRSLWFALYSSLLYNIVGGAYGVYFIIIGMHPYIPPLLKFSPEKYYIYEMFYFIPLSFIFIIMAAGIILFFGEYYKQKETRFDVLFSYATISIFTPFLLWTCWDGTVLILFLLGVLTPDKMYALYNHYGLVPILNTILVGLSMIWQIFMMYKAIKVALDITGIKAFIIAHTAVVIYMVIWLGVFKR